jgi:hypothetical protein
MIGARRGPLRIPPSLSVTARRLLLSEVRISVTEILTNICPEQVLALITLHLMDHPQESRFIFKLIETKIDLN